MSELNEMEDERYRSMREYSRVDAHLPLSIRSVPPEQRKCVRSKTAVETVLAVHSELPEVSDGALSECLRIINSKLDNIIKMLSFQTREHNAMRYENVNISAGGVSIVLEESFNIEEFLEIRLILPTLPYAVFYLYGVVVKSDAVAEGALTSVEFAEMDEDIREQIAKFVFERQREILRNKRRQ